MNDLSTNRPSRIILAAEAGLLREMLRHVITRSPHLQIVGEAATRAQLLTMVKRTDAEWVIVSLLPGGKLPDAAGAALALRPSLAILGITSDASQVKMGWTELNTRTITGASDCAREEATWVHPREAILEELTLADLIAVLHEAAPGERARQDESKHS